MGQTAPWEAGLIKGKSGILLFRITLDPVPKWGANLVLLNSGCKLDGVSSHAADDPFGEHPAHSERAESPEPELLL